MQNNTIKRRVSRKRKFIELIERVANIRIYRNLPRGIDISQDISMSFPWYSIDVVFDVGSNVGQSAKYFLNCFSNAKIYCFEPVRDTFVQLQKNTEKINRIQPIQIALGSYNGKGDMVIRGQITRGLSFLLDRSKDSQRREGIQTEVVNVMTLDQLCKDRKISQISYLKIDAEGGDLEVLEGGKSMLNAQRIDFVEVEAGMYVKNKDHVPFEILKDFLESRGYLLYGIYEQWYESKREPILRRTNPVYVSSHIIEMNTRQSG